MRTVHRLLGNFPVATANSLLVGSCLKSSWRFAVASRSVAETQRRLVLGLIRRAEATQFGQEHGFDRIRTVDEFRTRVPIRDYMGHLPYIEAIAEGRADVLTSDRVLLLQPSSGSTAPSKLIPFTDRLRREFMAGVEPWLANLYMNRKGLLSGSAYWAVTPPGNVAPSSDGPVPIGFDEDSRYFGAVEQLLLRRCMAVPDAVAAIDDMAACRYVTLLFLLRSQNLVLASVWNATFLTLLLKSIGAWTDRLLRDIQAGTLTPPCSLSPALHRQLSRLLKPKRRRAEQLSRILSDGCERGGFVRVWPRLKLVSCWCDGNAAAGAAELGELLPGVEIQPKGLMATEGIVSFPLLGQPGGALAVRSHFFEFIERCSELPTNDFSGCTTRLANELEQGRRYSVVLTTGGGLYRYYLGDLVEVVGFRGALPLLRFIGKEDDVSDMVGEKLHAAHVERVLQRVSRQFRTPSEFQMLAPHQSPMGSACYVLYVGDVAVDDGRLDEMAREIDSSLRENFHYDHSRNLGQLGPVRVFRVEGKGTPASEQRIAHLAACGRKMTTVKPRILEKDLDWAGAFAGRFVPSAEKSTEGKP